MHKIIIYNFTEIGKLKIYFPLFEMEKCCNINSQFIIKYCFRNSLKNLKSML